MYCLAFWSLSNNPLLKSSQEKYLFTFMSKAWPHQPYIDSADNALVISSADLALLIASDGDASFRWFAVFQSDPQQSLLLYHRSGHPITLDNGNTYCSMGVQWGYNWVPERYNTYCRVLARARIIVTMENRGQSLLWRNTPANHCGPCRFSIPAQNWRENTFARFTTDSH